MDQNTQRIVRAIQGAAMVIVGQAIVESANGFGVFYTPTTDFWRSVTGIIVFILGVERLWDAGRKPRA